MEKKRTIRINILICLIVLAGFLAMGGSGYATYSRVIREDIVNISKLTATGIYSEISNDLAKPVIVSLTMANDSFLKTWLTQEAAGDLSQAHQDALTQYLNGIREKYGYTSAFLVSDTSKRYYYYGGLNKVLSPENGHDKWYYDFLEMNKSYNLEIDTDEVNKNKLTVFVNCCITDQNGNLMGVTGVGVELDRVQEMIASFEKSFGLQAMLFDRSGVVQISTDTSRIGSENVFSGNGALGKRKADVLSSLGLTTVQYAQGGQNGFIITRYIEDMDWYLYVKKDTSVLVRSLYAQLGNDAFIFTLVAVLVVLTVSNLVRRNDRRLRETARTDSLTGLINRRGFNEALHAALGEPGPPLFLFVLDIDSFKKLNDTRGHLEGDKVLAQLGTVARGALPNGVVSRWGGDEYAGFLRGEEAEVMSAVANFFEVAKSDPVLASYNVTFCMGLTRVKPDDAEDTPLYRADRALYQAKEEGDGRLVRLDT